MNEYDTSSKARLTACETGEKKSGKKETRRSEGIQLLGLRGMLLKGPKKSKTHPRKIEDGKKIAMKKKINIG